MRKTFQNPLRINANQNKFLTISRDDFLKLRKISGILTDTVMCKYIQCTVYHSDLWVGTFYPFLKIKHFGFEYKKSKQFILTKSFLNVSGPLQNTGKVQTEME